MQFNMPRISIMNKIDVLKINRIDGIDFSFVPETTTHVDPMKGLWYKENEIGRLEWYNSNTNGWEESTRFNSPNINDIKYFVPIKETSTQPIIDSLDGITKASVGYTTQDGFFNKVSGEQTEFGNFRVIFQDLRDQRYYAIVVCKDEFNQPYYSSIKEVRKQTKTVHTFEPGHEYIIG